jgi:hypothetical protein
MLQRLRIRMAKWLAPELDLPVEQVFPKPTLFPKPSLTATAQIILLADHLGDHQQITHWAVSMRVTTKGNFIDRLKKGSDCSTKTYERVLARFSEIWPSDLNWPSDIPRPPKPMKEAA